jgi:hypothetical protein
MQHALGSLAAAALAAVMLAWHSGPLHANGPVPTHDQFVNDPNVRLFTPTPRVREPHEPVTAAPQPTVVVHVLVDARAHGLTHYVTLPGIVRKDHTRRGFAKRGFRTDWSFGATRGFKTNWSFGTSRGFKGGKSLHGSRGFKGGKSFRGGRGFSSGKSFTSRGGFGGWRGMH